MGLFFVIARNSSFVYKGRAVDIKQVGRELGVRYVLEGSVRRSGDRVRIAGQLISAETGYHIWADRFEGALEDVFDLQDRITEGIVSAMEPNVRRAEIERARVKSTSNLGAYDLLLRSLPGLLTPGTSRASKDESLSLIRRALEMDPRYALAKALGALACMGRVYEGFGTADDVKAGLRYADEALSERDDDAMVLSLAGGAIGGLGYRALGFRVLGFRHDEAIARRRTRAATESRSSAGAIECRGRTTPDRRRRHSAQAFRAGHAFQSSRPVNGAFVTYVGMAHLASGRLEEGSGSGATGHSGEPDLCHCPSAECARARAPWPGRRGEARGATPARTGTRIHGISVPERVADQRP